MARKWSITDVAEGTTSPSGSGAAAKKVSIAATWIWSPPDRLGAHPGGHHLIGTAKGDVEQPATVQIKKVVASGVPRRALAR